MSHRSLFWPITLIIIIATTMILVITSAPINPRAVVLAAATACATEGTNPAYPDCMKTASPKATSIPVSLGQILSGCPTSGPENNPPYPPYAQCLQTRTAILLQTQQAGAPPTSAPAANNVQPSATPTSTSTATPTLTSVASETPLVVNTLRPTDTPRPTYTPSPVLDETAAAIAATPCVPGDIIEIVGTEDPGIALIVTFGGRPVGGGFTSNDGSYRIRLRIGDERPGIYPVNVEDRMTRDLIQTLNCLVPAFTPTPTPTPHVTHP